MEEHMVRHVSPSPPSQSTGTFIGLQYTNDNYAKPNYFFPSSEWGEGWHEMNEWEYERTWSWGRVQKWSVGEMELWERENPEKNPDIADFLETLRLKL